MKKILLILLLTTFLIGCSNTKLKNDFSLRKKEELSILVDSIKENLSINNIDYVKMNTKESVKNNYILREIENIYFLDLNIFISKPKFFDKKNSAISRLALNFSEETIYLELEFIYDFRRKKWLINDLKKF